MKTTYIALNIFISLYSASFVLLYTYSRQIFRETYLLFSMIISMLKNEMNWRMPNQQHLLKLYLQLKKSYF